ncbi:hypothetical protein STEG23_028428, partial [Scotinomys teguina]
YDMITVILQHIINNSTFNLTETSCFWRIKHNEEDDGDLRNDCEILLLLSQEPIEEYFYKRIINFRTIKDYVYKNVNLWQKSKGETEWLKVEINKQLVYLNLKFLQRMNRQHEFVYGVYSKGLRNYFLLNSLLKKRVFTNPIGELVDMNQRRKLCADYDIYYIWNFPHGFGIKYICAIKICSIRVITWCLRTITVLGKGPSSILTASVLDGLQLTLPTSACSMTCSSGFRKFHEEQEVDCCFHCALCPENEVSNETVDGDLRCFQLLAITNSAAMNIDMEQCVLCQEDQYSNTEHTHCLQRHVSYLAFEDPLGITLACMSLCFSALTALVLGAFVKYNDTPIVKANNRILSYILLISITLCFLSSFLFIGHPNTVTCVLQQTTFGVFFTVAVSTVLAKTITVVLAFKLTTPGERLRGMLVSGAPKFVIPICTVVQLILCGIWMVTSPPFIDTDTHSEHGQIIIVCNKGSVIAFHFVLGYLGSLALGSFTVAFLARNLPDRFNEAKFLTFSMLVFCSVWVTFLPVYHSTKGKVMVAVEVFSILASSAGELDSFCSRAFSCAVKSLTYVNLIDVLW